MPHSLHVVTALPSPRRLLGGPDLGSVLSMEPWEVIVRATSVPSSVRQPISSSDRSMTRAKRADVESGQGLRFRIGTMSLSLG